MLSFSIKCSRVKSGSMPIILNMYNTGVNQHFLSPLTNVVHSLRPNFINSFPYSTNSSKLKQYLTILTYISIFRGYIPMSPLTAISDAYLYTPSEILAIFN